MEFFDEESRPRILLQSRSTPKSTTQNQSPQTLETIHKPTLFLSLSLSAILLSLSIFYFNYDPFQSLLIWCSLSFLVGPFAPLNLTAGDIRVGQGPTIQPSSPPRYSQEPDPPKRSRFRAKKIDQDDNFMTPFIPLNKTLEPISSIRSNEKDNDSDKNAVFTEEKEWSDGDLELLKKQMVKNPVGMPGRWEAVAEVFNGRHKVESVVKMAKSMGDRRMGGGDGDSFSRFLKDRKAVDKRVDEVIESEMEENKVVGNGGSGGGSWSSSEDIALLNALKAFPKDVAMRWEKITAAVPGRSKAACMKRVADLKKDFRSSKTSSEA